jgi:hypothetical protein
MNNSTNIMFDNHLKYDKNHFLRIKDIFIFYSMTFTRQNLILNSPNYCIDQFLCKFFTKNRQIRT